MTAPADALVPICPLGALTPERGAAALLPDGTQIAVFRLHDDSLFALSNRVRPTAAALSPTRTFPGLSGWAADFRAH